MNEELKIIITAEIDKLKKNLQDGKKETQDFGEKGKKSLEAFGKACAAAGKATAAAMKVVGGAVAAGAAALVGLSEATEEYRTNQAKLVTAFETAGAGADEAKAAYNDLYRVLGDDGQATEAAAHLAQLTTNEQDLAEWTNICQGVYATFGDSLPIEGLTEAANETAKVGQVTGGLADALNWAGISEDAFNEKLAACNSEAEREALIRTTLNGVYNEAAASYEKNAASILAANEAQAALTDGMAQLGAAATPIVTVFKQIGADLLTSVAPSFSKVSEGLMDMVNGVDGGADKMKQGIQEIVDTVLKTLTDMLPELLQVGLDIVVALIEGIAEALPDVIEAVVEIIPTILEALEESLPQITEAILGALPLLLEAIMQIVTGILEGLAEILPVILEQIVAIIPQIIETFIANIPALLEGAITLFMAIVDAIPVIVVSLVEALPQIVTSILDAVIQAIPQLIEAAIQLFMAIVEAIPVIIPAVLEALPQIITSVIEALINLIPVLLEAAVDLFMAIVQAVPKIIPFLLIELPKIVNEVQINLANKLGEIFKNIWNKLTEIFGKVKDWFKQKFTDAVTAIKNVFSGIGDFFTGVWDKIKNIFSKVGKAIGDAVSGAFKNAINFVLEKAIGIINGFIGAINTAIGIINKIPGVSISKLKKLDVPELAEGGVIDSATLAVVGEKGKEAVMPLENNLGWLDKLAGMLNERMGGSAPIILQVDGKTFAQISVDSINQLTKQTGILPLRLV